MPDNVEYSLQSALGAIDSEAHDLLAACLKGEIQVETTGPQTYNRLASIQEAILLQEIKAARQLNQLLRMRHVLAKPPLKF